MAETITFSRQKLETFLICQRQFQLRYLKQLAWPMMPLSERAEAMLARGAQFHQLLERHFLGLPVNEESVGDADLHSWWRRFQNSGLALPAGRLLPEITLTIPVGDHLLTARFDLLVVGEANGQAFAHLFDWKTGKAQSVAELQRDWQTRLYLAILMQGSKAVLPAGPPLTADRIAITYWYITDPENPRMIHYEQQWHAKNWAEIQALVSRIDRELLHGEWPLTDDWSHCRRCVYQVYCGRQEAGPMESEVAEREILTRPEILTDMDEPHEEDSLQLEPDSP